ncbi:LPXTG cell wall anchor domain-containing protein [Arthrobacter sp. BF1]|uniref:LPXTG cell wall anchor domain-containing protein n=1 Tax=Arthrobacter sp. BF1 TaxID=2821145 RepID=UPI001C4E7127|nr:LPXTG cell wall anchor domain-containing protein [Arthrobacter sp. BF1]
MLRVAAGMLGLALVGSVGVGAVASSPDTVDLPAAAAEATPAAAETTPAAAAPSEEPATVGEATSEPVAPTKAAPKAPVIDAAPKAAALALKEAPAVQALAATPALTCASGVVYTIDTGGQIRQVSTDTGAQSQVGAFDASSSLNGFALSKDGNYAYAVRTTPDQSGNMTVYRYEPSTGATTSSAGVQNISGSQAFVMGGINPVNGFYYYGRINSSYMLEIFAFNTVTNQSVGKVGSVDVGTDNRDNRRGNGDLVFSSDGKMYFVASSGAGRADSNVIMEVSNVPTTRGSGNLIATIVTALTPTNQRFNGIAFAGGNLYLDTTGGHLYKVDASTGQQVGSSAITTGLSSPVDMASCQYNNTLQVQKNIGGRVVSTDQFKLTASVGATEIGASGTTAGSATGLQTGPGTFASSIPTSGSTITIREVGVAGADLAQYTSSWVCSSADGAWTKKSEDGTSSTSGTFVFPAQSNAGVNVTCVFTNTPLSAKVTVTKTWVNAISGDQASFTANAGTVSSPDSPEGSSTAPTNGNVITASFARGTTVNVSEVLATGNKGVYTTTLKCTNAAGTSVGTVEAGALKGSFTLGASDVICAFTNTNKAATIMVQKQWIVDGKPYTNGQQPAGISAALTLTGATAPKWGTVYPGYFAGNTVTIAETTTIDPTMACKVADSQVTLANGTTTSSKVPYAAVLAAGANSYTVTNTVECTTVLTLLKFIDNSNGGTLVPGDFTLTAKPGTGEALTVAGANTVADANTKSVTAGLNYELSESSAGKPAYLQLSLQRYTGKLNADKSLANPDAWMNAESATVSVQTGKHEVYRFVNASVPAFALPLTGGAGNWTYMVVGGGLLLVAILFTAWVLVRKSKTNR